MHITIESSFFTPVIFYSIFLIFFTFREVSAGSSIIDLDSNWDLYKKLYSKEYRGDEEIERHSLWERKCMSNILHNLKADFGLATYRRGLNCYSDFTPEEVKKYLKGFKDNGFQGNSSKWVRLDNVDHPTSVDWREEGLVTGVKNQGRCGSCWAFSAIAALEGQHKKKTGDLVALSEQQLIDCSTNDVNSGCEGGLMAPAFEYLKNSEGLCTESSYPYKEEQSECQYKPANIVSQISGYMELTEGDEDALLDAVATVGPVAVAIDAAHESFMSYKSGIYEEPECSNEQFDHAVVVVGFGTEDGHPYWLLKNSWGESWGEKGYMKMLRNNHNMCGIANKASYPLV